MINDLKENIMKYITGNITPEQEKANYFRGNDETNSSIEEALAEKGFTVNNYSILTTTTTSNYLVYGGGIIDRETRGFIAVLNQEGNVLDLITQYDSGVNLQWIWYLDYDENGTIYGIDESTQYPHNLRFILLNNVALETPRGYYCKLRASYYINQSNYDLPSSQRFEIAWQDYSAPHIVRKVPGEATYFIFGYYGGDYSSLIKFVNNVGMANEWELYVGHALGQDTDSIYKFDMQIEKVDDDYKAYIYYTDADARLLKYEMFNGTSLTNYQEFSFTEPIMCIRVADKDTMYFTTRHNNLDGTYSMSLHEIENGIEKTITGFTFETSIPAFNLNIEDGVLYGIAKGSQTVDGVFKYNYVCIAYKGGEIVVSPVYSFQPNPATNINFNTAVQSSFALHRLIVLSNNKVYHPAVVIYDNMYSGEAYESYGIASTQKGELYTTGNKIVFARGLYNKQIYNNQTTSSIEIPSGYLNDIPITNETIISKDNTTLITENQNITKNIYETLFLNFTNSISVIDEDTNTAYSNVANYINANTNVGTKTNYDDTAMGKIRIRYTDHVVTTPITWVSIDSTHYKIETIVDATTEVPYLIEFISNDESTTYLSKELPLTLGNYYKITQKIRIE